MEDFTLLTATQVASQLNVSRQAVLYWIKTGQLPAVQDNSGKWLIQYKDLNAYIEARMAKAR